MPPPSPRVAWTELSRGHSLKRFPGGRGRIARATSSFPVYWIYEIIYDSGGTQTWPRLPAAAAAPTGRPRPRAPRDRAYLESCCVVTSLIRFSTHLQWLGFA